MRGYCAEFAKHQQVDVDFTQSNVPSSLPPDIALGLFRVLQEALHNAVKHSGAQKFEVCLSGVSGQAPASGAAVAGVQLTIRDHGKGFDPEATASGSGLGLVSMRERVNLVKGAISIISKPNFGTEITVRIPLFTDSGARRSA